MVSMTLTVPGLKYFSRWFGKLTINSTIQHHQKLLQNPVSLGPCIFSLAFGFLALAELIWLSLGMGTSLCIQSYWKHASFLAPGFKRPLFSLVVNSQMYLYHIFIVFCTIYWWSAAKLYVAHLYFICEKWNRYWYKNVLLIHNTLSLRSVIAYNWCKHLPTLRFPDIKKIRGMRAESLVMDDTIQARPWNAVIFEKSLTISTQ